MRISYKNLKRYKEIAYILIKYGFSFIVEKLNIEEVAYKIINKVPNEDESTPELTLDEISEFNNIAQESIDAYNTFLVKKVDAQETQQINEKIAELNSKIKELTQLYDDISAKNQKQISEELNHQQEQILE